MECRYEFGFYLSAMIPPSRECLRLDYSGCLRLANIKTWKCTLTFLA